MATPSDRMLTQLHVAAELRAAGKTWETVAKALHRQPATCWSWPTRYRAIWNRLLGAAVRARVQEIGCEAREFLRQVLRSKDPKLVVAAARQLLPRSGVRRTVKQSAAEPDRELLAYLSRVRSMSDEDAVKDLEKLLAQLRLGEQTGGEHGSE